MVLLHGCRSRTAQGDVAKWPKAAVCKTAITGSNPVVASKTKRLWHNNHSRFVLEATTGFEPVMAVLQTAALGHLATSPCAVL